MNELKSYIFKDKNISIQKHCELLDLNLSTIYYLAVPESIENLIVMRHMDEYFLDHSANGVLQMQDYLLAIGFLVNHKHISLLLLKMGIMALYLKHNLSKLGHSIYIRPYLLRGLKIERPIQVWEINITYIPMRKGFMYLTAIIDVHSRYVVGWNIFNSLDAQNSLSVLQSTIALYGKHEIINSDQGSQFTSDLWIYYLENQKGIIISMGGKGRAIDNIFTERLWRTVKQDCVYIWSSENGVELYQGLKKFFDYYKNKKSHQGIGRKAPIKLYRTAA